MRFPELHRRLVLGAAAAGCWLPQTHSVSLEMCHAKLASPSVCTFLSVYVTACVPPQDGFLLNPGRAELYGWDELLVRRATKASHTFGGQTPMHACSDCKRVLET